MLYPYMTLNDGTEVCYSQILEGHKVVVNFERPTEDGFDSARCELVLVYKCGQEKSNNLYY